MSGFGKAKLETQFEGPKRFKMSVPDAKKGETETVLVLRLLPSMKSYRDSGNWKFYYGQHYGYSGVNQKDPSKPYARPFGCIQKKNKAKEITTHCPKCDQMQEFENRKKQREDELAKANGFDSEEGRKSDEFRTIKRNDVKYTQSADWLQKHNCDRKFHINVIDRNGDPGTLTLSYTTTDEHLMPLLRKLESGEATGEKVDPFDPSSGIWLKFTRSGKAPRVVDKIEVFEDFVDIGNGKKAKVAVAAPLTQEQIEKCLKICKDLATEAVTFIDAETIQKLVECSGAPDEVDAIWPPANAKTESKKTAPRNNVDDGESLTDDLPAREYLSPPTEQVPAPEKEVEALSEEDAEEAALQAQMEAVKARKAAKTKAASPAPAMGAMPDNADDFLKSFAAK